VNCANSSTPISARQISLASSRDDGMVPILSLGGMRAGWVVAPSGLGHFTVVRQCQLRLTHELPGYR
jgi:hypothetical protein